MSQEEHFINAGASAPSFEGFILRMVDDNQAPRAEEIIVLLLGAEWQVNPVPDDPASFEVTHRLRKEGALSMAGGWQMTYRLRAEPGVVYAEPIFAVPITAPPLFSDEPPGAGREEGGVEIPPGQVDFSSPFGEKLLKNSEDPMWSLNELKVIEAWELFKPLGRLPGEGVIIGHPDTGYRRHPEIANNLLVELGYDFVKEDDDAEDELEGSILTLRFPGHGTGTASVLVSSPEAKQSYPADPSGKAVCGIAPGARLIPLRVSRSVVLWEGSTLNLARAMERATDKGAHVISMSMGTGFPNERLLAAVRYAQKRGVIVCAAAGNYVRYVVWPAGYDEVIGVAASNADRGVWKHSSRGSRVDVTAPGESVWVAAVKKTDDGVDHVVGRSSGTSFAVAAVAGVAALWLSYHGRDTLIAKYGAEKIPFIFNELLRRSCEPVAAWPEKKFGAGLVNALRLLQTPLPDATLSPVTLPSFGLQQNPPVGAGGMETFAYLFEQDLAPPVGGVSFTPGAGGTEQQLGRPLAELLSASEDELPSRLREVGQELAFYLATDPALYERFESALATAGGPPSFTVGADPSISALRAGLMAKGTSEALKVKIASGD